MAALDPKIKEAFLSAVHAHLAANGAKEWSVVLDAFPNIGVATKWRLIREARGMAPPPGEIQDARDRLVASVKKFPTTTRAQRAAKDKLDPSAEGVVDHLPAAPSPAYIAKHGDAGLRTIDFVAEIQSLYGDAKMLRAFGVKMKTGANGEQIEAIHNPAAFDKSIVRRAHLLETAINAVQQVWDLRTMQAFYETIIEEIGKESPAAQRRIMERLAVLNQNSGMTLGSMRV
jgi:hypothetical protein